MRFCDLGNQRTTSTLVGAASSLMAASRPIRVKLKHTESENSGIETHQAGRKILDDVGTK
jgi:hypothetical protein